MSKVVADQIVLRMSGAEFLRRRAFDKRTYHSFSRADSSTCATYMDRNGLARLAPAGKLRVDWDDPLGGSALVPSLLLEGPRQNILDNGDVEADSVGWVANSSTILRDSTQAARGTWAVKVTTQNVTSSGVFVRMRSGARAPIVATSNRLHTWHIRVFAPAASVGKTVKIRIEWWSVTPAFLGATEVTGIVLAAGWQWLKVTSAALTSAVTADCFVGGDNAQGIWDFWADLAQLEEGAFFSSSIPTGTATLARNFDTLDTRIALDMDRDWSLYFYAKQHGSNVATWPDTEPQNDSRVLSLHPTIDASDGDLGGGIFLQRQNGATQYDYRYFNVVGQASRTFSVTPNAQKFVIRQHAADHHLSIAIDNSAFVEGTAPSTVTIKPIQLLRLGTNAFMRFYNVLLAYELHTQAEMEAAA